MQCLGLLFGCVCIGSHEKHYLFIYKGVRLSNFVINISTLASLLYWVDKTELTPYQTLF